MTTHRWRVSIRVQTAEGEAVLARVLELPFGPLDHDELPITFCGESCCDAGLYDYHRDDVTFDALRGEWIVWIDQSEPRPSTATLRERIDHWRRAGFFVVHEEACDVCVDVLDVSSLENAFARQLREFFSAPTGKHQNFLEWLASRSAKAQDVGQEAPDQ